MENVMFIELVQRFASADMYLSYIQQKYGPNHVRCVRPIMEVVDFGSTHKKTFSCKVIGGEVLALADEAGIFNVVMAATEHKLKPANPIIACLMYIELLDKDYLRKKYGNLYFIASGIPAKVSGHSGISFYLGTEIPAASLFPYGNFSFASFVKSSGFLFEVSSDPIPVSYDRV